MRSEPVQSDLAVLMSLIVLPRPHRRPPQAPGEMFSVRIAFFLQPPLLAPLLLAFSDSVLRFVFRIALVQFKLI